MSKLPTLYAVSEIIGRGERDYFSTPCAHKEDAESLARARQGHYPLREARVETLIPASECIPKERVRELVENARKIASEHDLDPLYLRGVRATLQYFEDSLSNDER